MKKIKMFIKRRKKINRRLLIIIKKQFLIDWNIFKPKIIFFLKQIYEFDYINLSSSDKMLVNIYIILSILVGIKLYELWYDYKYPWVTVWLIKKKPKSK